MVSVVRQMGGLPPVSATLTVKESCTDDPRRAKGFAKRVSIVCPDPEAYKRCCNFKVTPLSSSSAHPSTRQAACDLSDLSALSGHFSKEEKAKTVLCNDQLRQGFKDSVYFVDSGGQWRTCNCDCNFFGRNNLCYHCLSIATHLNCVADIVEAYEAEVSARYQQLLLQKMLVGKLYLESGLYLQLK